MYNLVDPKKHPLKETTRTQLAKFMHIVLSKLCDCEKDVVKLRAILIVPIKSDVVIFTMNESYLNRIKCSFFDRISPSISLSLSGYILRFLVSILEWIFWFFFPFVGHYNIRCCFTFILFPFSVVFPTSSFGWLPMTI